jgi:hypothetical protein
LNHTWNETASASTRVASDKRTAERRAVMLPARITWKDQRGTTRFASVVTRDVSEFGVYIECPTPVSIPLYRLVQFQLERDPQSGETPLPDSIRQGRVLSAVYRVKAPTAAGSGQGFALRLMVDPARRQAAPAQRRATA